MKTQIYAAPEVKGLRNTDNTEALIFLHFDDIYKVFSLFWIC